MEAQSPNVQQYFWGQPKDMDKRLAIDLRRLWAFLESTQQNVLDEYKGKDLKTELPKRISKDIETFGVIKVLREGVDVDNIHVSLFYPRPSAADSKASKQKYFTMDKDEVFFTTRLNLGKTNFMPFNQGLPNGQGAGNPGNTEGGYSLYKEYQQNEGFKADFRSVITRMLGDVEYCSTDSSNGLWNS